MLTRSTIYHHRGGMEDHIDALVNGLRKKHDVDVITTSCKGMRDKNGYYFLDGTSPGKYSKCFWIKSKEKFLKLYKENKYDIVHSQSAGAFGLLKNKLNIPVVASLHGTIWDEFVTNFRLANPFIKTGLCGSFLYRWLKEFNKVRHCDGIIATSNEQADIIKKLYFLPDKKIYKVYNGIDTTQFFSRNYKDKKIVLCVARFIKQKGVQNIIKAFPKILEQVPDAKLVLVGDGPYMGQLKRFAKGLDIEFTGIVPLAKLPEYFNKCSVFVNPTEQQNGYDLTILEAMACNKPVIVSRIGSVPTVVNDNNGILIRVGDVNGLADACIRILKDDKLRIALGRFGRRDVVEKFSVERMIDNTIDVYEQLLG
jgi:glycosyltransferase involved in cell wall biosynthesis